MAITAAELLVKVGADTSDAESGLKSFSSKMKNVGGQMAAVGGVLSATVAAPLIGIAVSAVKTAADFEKSMNVLGYASNASAKQMQAMSDQALQLGADTVFSANEAAEGMVDLAKAGMGTEDIMGAIPGVMDLAAAGQIGVSEAANLTAAALSTFNLEADQAAHVADVLAAAANASTADVADLAFGMQNAGSVFNANGQSLESLATMMALLSNNGIKASDAATSLKTMTMMLTAPTAVAAKTMKKLGLSVFDAEGNMRDYHDIIADLSSITKDMSDAQRDAAFQVLFGADATRAAIILSDEGVKGYEAMATAVGEQGAAANMAAAQNAGLAGAMEQISGSIESLFTKLALPFLPTIAEWTGNITAFINQIGELPQPVINAALAFGGFAVAFSVTMAAIGGAMLLLAPLGGTMGLIALAILGLGLAVAALWAAWELNWGNIQGKTEDVLAVINPLLSTLSSALSSAGTTLSNFKMPNVADLQKLKSNVEMQVSATVKTFLKAPVLTIAPFPPMTIPPPPVIIQPLKTITLAAPKPGSAEAGFASIPGQIIDNLTATIKGGDWGLAGRIMANLVILKWNQEVGKIEPFLTIISIAAGVGNALATAQTNIVLALLQFGIAIGGTGLPEKIAALGTAISTAFTTMWTGLISQIMASVTKSPDATSTSDILRERQLGPRTPTIPTPEWVTSLLEWKPTLPPWMEEMKNWKFSKPEWVTNMLAWDPKTPSWVTKVTTWTANLPEWVTTLTGWTANLPDWIATLTGWNANKPTWLDSMINWYAFTPTWLNSLLTWVPDMPGWVSALLGWNGPPAAGGGIPGAKQDPLPGLPIGAAGFTNFPGGMAWVGEEGPELVNLPRGSNLYPHDESMAMAGGVTINVNVASINNGMDIEQLAAQLARRFQQKLRL